jgi:GntR family transcriptional regulator
MMIQIHPADGVPIYQQIMTQIRYLIASGRLAVGEELPAIRTLAEQLRVNPNTVARAYRELQQEGLVDKRSTTGTFVSDHGSPLARRHRHRLLAERVDQMLAESRQMGFSVEEVIELVRQRNQRMGTLGKGVG